MTINWVIRTFKSNRVLENVTRATMILCSIVFLIVFYSSIFGDVLITTTHGINFWECLFSGNIRNFYELNTNVPLVSSWSETTCNARYDFLIYILFAIWDFPLWILIKTKLVSYPLLTIGGQMWAKSITLPFLILCLMFMNRIMKHANKSRERILLMDWLFLTSFFTMSAIGIVGQYDVIVLAYIIMGLYFGLKDNMWLSVLFFALAVGTKAFAIIPFIVLVLYWEKNIWKELIYIIVGIIPTILSRIVVPFSAAPNTETLVSKLFNSSLPFPHGESTIIVLLIVISLFAYSREKANHYSDLAIESNYLIMVSYVIFLSCMNAYPYWYIYMTPFVVMAMCNNDNLIGLLIIEETIMCFSMQIALCKEYYWVYSSQNVRGMLFSHYVANKDVIVDLNGILQRILSENLYNFYSLYFTTVMSSIYVGMMICFIIQTNPYLRKEKNGIISKYYIQAVIIIRTLIIIMFGFLPVVEALIGGK